MYNLFYAANNENNAQYGYVLMKDKIVVKEIYFDKEKMAYADIVGQKIDFLTEILNDFPEINWKRMLITLVAQDDDIVDDRQFVIVEDFILAYCIWHQR